MVVTVTGVRLKPAGKVLQYITDDLELQRGQKCVVESDDGLEIATVIIPPHALDIPNGQHALKPIIRRAECGGSRTC